MGLFDNALFTNAKQQLGIIDAKLLSDGTLARGNIVSVTPTGMTIGQDSGLAYGPEKVCEVVVEVVPLDGSDFYQATCLHPVPLIHIPKLQESGAAVAVRVDPADPQRIALDLGTEVPPAPIVLESDDGTRQVVKTNVAPVTAADILRDGQACTVDVLAVIPLNQLTQDGKPATGLILSVHRDGVPPYQAQIGTHIPDAAIATVVPGASLPARWQPGTGAPTDVNLVTPDWPLITA